MSNKDNKIYKFDTAKVEVENLSLYRNGELIDLDKVPFQILVLLIENRRKRPLNKESIAERIEKSPGHYVEPESVPNHITQIRKALGQTEETRYIINRPGIGYCFNRDIIVEEYTPNIERNIEETVQATVSSIAILLFESWDSKQDDQYISFGITNTLITKLGALPQLTVRSVSEVRKYVGIPHNPAMVGEDLKVDAVLEGNILIVGNYIRVWAKLMRVLDGRQMWGETFEEKFTDISIVIDSISRRVAEKLIRVLSSEDEIILAKRYTNNQKALEHYWKGLYIWNRRTPEALEQSIRWFQKAIDLDPKFALAYASLASSYNLLGYYSVMPPKIAMPQAKVAAEKAIEIDNTLAEAYSSLAVANHCYEWDWEEAERNFRRSIELDPKYATAYQKYGWCLCITGRTKEAIEQTRRAHELDPLSPIIATRIGTFLYFDRQYEQAIEQCLSVLEMDPLFTQAHLSLGMSYEQLGRFEEAIETLQRAVDLSDKAIEMVAALGRAYAAAGKQNMAAMILNQLLKESKEENKYISPYYIAKIYAGLGNEDEAFQWLERSFEEKEENITYINVDPAMDYLREDPRFGQLLYRIGLNKSVGLL